MRVTGSAISRESRIGPVLGHDERAAVGGVAAVLGRVVAVLEDQVAGLGTGGDRDRVGVGREAEVPETEDRQSDEAEGDDPGRGEGAGGRVFMTAPLWSSACLDATSAAARRPRRQADSRSTGRRFRLLPR